MLRHLIVERFGRMPLRSLFVLFWFVGCEAKLDLKRGVMCVFVLFVLM